MKRLFRVLRVIIVAIFLTWMVLSFTVRGFQVGSGSMEPTLKKGDCVILDRMTYHTREPMRGEVIAFRFDPNDPDNLTQGENFVARAWDLMGEIAQVTHEGTEYYVKRVIGLPEDHVEMINGIIFVNGIELVEDYPVVRDYSNATFDVPERSVLVLGDNRMDSYDSRYWGYVPYDSIIGRAVARYWPLSRAGSIE
ncbi:MAG: signal peptidase I [Candidatus Geothermincolia bacterium]